MDIKAIIFDKDGTLIDFAATFNPATKQVIDKLSGGDQKRLEAIADVWGFDLQTGVVADDSVIVAGSGIDLAGAVLPILEIDDQVSFAQKLDEMFGAICVKTVQALPGVREALDVLSSKQMALGIGTNDAEANAVAQMETLGFRPLFREIFGADSGHGAKPGPGMVTAFVESSGLKPRQVMMVGDSLHDLEAGSAAGVVTCGVETGPAERATLEKHADIVLPSISQLPEYLGISGGS